MKPLKSIVRRWKALFQRESTETELEDEIQLHLEMETAKNIRGGMNVTSCICRGDLGTSLVSAAQTEAGVIVFIGRVSGDDRFPEFLPLFKEIVESIRIGKDARQHADELLEIPTERLKLKKEN